MRSEGSCCVFIQDLSVSHGQHGVDFPDDVAHLINDFLQLPILHRQLTGHFVVLVQGLAIVVTYVNHEIK